MSHENVIATATYGDKVHVNKLLVKYLKDIDMFLTHANKSSQEREEQNGFKKRLVQNVHVISLNSYQLLS
mgnify:FL=1